VVTLKNQQYLIKTTTVTGVRERERDKGGGREEGRERRRLLLFRFSPFLLGTPGPYNGETQGKAKDHHK